MKKVFALLSVAAVFAFASCEDKKVEDAAATDSVAVVVPVDTAAAMPVDTAAVVDTTMKH